MENIKNVPGLNNKTKIGVPTLKSGPPHLRKKGIRWDRLKEHVMKPDYDTSFLEVSTKHTRNTIF